MRIVHFGAGNIGRGAIPEIFDKLYDHITFIDPFNGIVDKLNKIKSYNIKNVNNINVHNYDAILMSDTTKVIEALNNADVISTACGFDNLKAVAELINQMSNIKKIHVICFENNVRPTSELRINLTKPENFIFLDCTIDRVVPKQAMLENSLDLMTEDYLKVIVEQNQEMNKQYFKNCEIVEDLSNYISLKLFAVNGLHFIMAILTYNHGGKYIHEYLENVYVKNTVHEYTDLLTDYLCIWYDFKKEYICEFINYNLKRFANILLNDECTRIARNSKLKLGCDNRVIPVLRYALEQNIKTDIVYKILSEIFSYKNDQDEDSVEIQKYLNSHTLEETINHFSGLKTNISKYVGDKND